MIYAGIGSRRTPVHALALMTELARVLCSRGWILRTGGAAGADSAFRGALESGVELYLPWPWYGAHKHGTLDYPLPRAYEIAARYHPVWETLDGATRSLLARNCHVVLGPELDDPVRMICCWTPDGSLDGAGSSGGTGHALRVAAGEALEVEVINLRRPGHWARITRFLDPDGDRFPPSPDGEPETLF